MRQSKFMRLVALVTLSASIAGSAGCVDMEDAPLDDDYDLTQHEGATLSEDPVALIPADEVGPYGETQKALVGVAHSIRVGNQDKLRTKYKCTTIHVQFHAWSDGRRLFRAICADRPGIKVDHWSYPLHPTVDRAKGIDHSMLVHSSKMKLHFKIDREHPQKKIYIHDNRAKGEGWTEAEKLLVGAVKYVNDKYAPKKLRNPGCYWGAVAAVGELMALDAAAAAAIAAGPIGWTVGYGLFGGLVALTGTVGATVASCLAKD